MRLSAGLALLLCAFLLVACNTAAIEPDATASEPEATTAEESTGDETADDETAGEAEETPTPAAAEETAPTVPAGPTVPPPDLEDRGPAAELAPRERNGMYEEAPEMTIDPESYYYATLKTNRGDIEVQLFAERAPTTVNNFVFLAQQGFYDNTKFHRVIDGFMAQAGDPTGTGTGGPGYEFEDEIYPGLVFDQSGLLAMANAGPNTNGSQFFITFGPTDWLNGNHTIFGKVIEGEDVMSQLTRRDPSAQEPVEGDTIYAILIEQRESSELPTPTAAPPTATPTPTPTPYAPTSLEDGDRPLAELPAAERVGYFNTPPEQIIDTAQQYTATIRTNKGDLVVELHDDAATMAVNNFVVLANLGFYDETPISLVRPEDSVIIGAPDNNPLNDAGYNFEAELGAVEETGVGAITYIPVEQQEDGTILSSSSQLLIALIEPPAETTAQLAFFGQIVEGLDVLPELTTSDTITAIEISSAAE